MYPPSSEPPNVDLHNRKWNPRWKGNEWRHRHVNWHSGRTVPPRSIHRIHVLRYPSPLDICVDWLGSNVSGNIISMYENSAAATFGRAAIVVLMLFSYPLQAHPCRGSLDKIFAWRPGTANQPPAPTPKSGPTQMRYRFFSPPLSSFPTPG